MSTGAAHYAEAERLLAGQVDAMADAHARGGGERTVNDVGMAVLTRALVHATLALTAATIDSSPPEAPTPDQTWAEWNEVLGQ